MPLDELPGGCLRIVVQILFEVVCNLVGACFLKVVTLGKIKLPPFDAVDGDWNENAVSLVGLLVIAVVVAIAVLLLR